MHLEVFTAHTGRCQLYTRGARSLEPERDEPTPELLRGIGRPKGVTIGAALVKLPVATGDESYLGIVGCGRVRHP